MRMWVTRVAGGAVRIGAWLPCLVAVFSACGDVTSKQAAPPLPPATGLLARPQAITIVPLADPSPLVVVGNTHFDPETLDFGPGSIAVLRADSGAVVAKVPTSQPNPQAMVTLDDSLWVLATGRTRFRSKEGINHAEGPGALDRFPLEALAAGALEAAVDSLSLPLVPERPTTGGFGTMAVDPIRGFAWLGSGLSPIVVKVDLRARRVLRGPDDPIRIRDAPEGNDTVVVAWHPDGVVLVTSFNANLLYRVDPDSDAIIGAPVTVAETGLLEGPIDIAVAPHQSPDVFILLTLASAIATWSPTAPEGVNPRAFATDAVSNAIRVHAGGLFVLNSGANSLWRYSLDSGDLKSPLVTFPLGSSPYAMAAFGERAWVTLNLADALAEVDTSTGAIVRYVR